MRKVALVLILGLAACAGNKQPTALDNLATIEQTFTAAETGFLAYSKFPNCDAHPAPCSDTAILAKAKPLDAKAFDAVQAYRTAILAGVSDSILQQLLTAANVAIAELAASYK